MVMQFSLELTTTLSASKQLGDVIRSIKIPILPHYPQLHLILNISFPSFRIVIILELNCLFIFITRISSN